MRTSCAQNAELTGGRRQVVLDLLGDDGQQLTVHGVEMRARRNQRSRRRLRQQIKRVSQVL